MRHLALMIIAIASALPACASAQPPEMPKVSSAIPRSDFVTVNGVRLHYIDYGGAGPALIFLAGMGNGAHVFDDLAPSFTDSFRVLAVTRRGYGRSDKPASGYDTDVLVADLAGFIDALDLKRASLVGHSIAGGELTRFAGLHPDRVDRLVYLDAAYDRELLPKLTEEDPAGDPQPGPSDTASFEAFEAWYGRTLGFWSPALAADLRELYRAPDGSLRPTTPRAVGQALYDGMVAFRPDYRPVRAPALALYAIQTKPDMPPGAGSALRVKAQTFVDTVYAPWQRAQARRFDREIACSRIVLFPGAHHYLFIEQRSKVEKVMREFLTASRPC